ncbi:MAG: PAS domain S-box protein [Opitutae bacterium]|nr:PAS domain S-box protein [Opitutae bacterium]
MPSSLWARRAGWSFLLAAGYFLLGELGFLLSLGEVRLALVWLPTGVAAGVLVRFGTRWWPGIAAGAFLVNWINGLALPGALSLAASHVLGSLLVAGLLRVLGFESSFQRRRDIGLLALAAAAGSVVTASNGLVQLRVAGLLGPGQGGGAWLAWWLSDCLGILVAAPVMLVCRSAAVQPLRARWRESVTWLLGSALLLIFVDLEDRWSREAPLEFLPLLLVGWGALRFGVAGTAVGVLLVACATVAGTILHLGPGDTAVTLKHALTLDWLHVSGVVALGWLLTGMLLDRQRAFDRLTASEASLRLRERALASVKQGVLIADPSRRITYANATFERLTGYRADEILGRTCRVLQGRETDPQTVVRLREALVAEQAFEGEILNYRKDGTAFWNDLRIFPVHDEAGQLTCFVGIQRDVTERRRVEAALSESEQRFRLLADQAPVLIWMSGPDKRCTYVNQGWLSFTGRRLAQEMGNGWAEAVHPEDMPRCRVIHDRSFDRRESFKMEYRLRRAGGDYRWILDHGVPRFDATGMFLGYVGCCTDIDDEKRNAEALQEQRRLLRAVLDHAPLGIWMQNRDGRLQFVNDAFCQAVGIPEERFLSVPHYAELYDPATAASCMASDREALTQNGPHVSRERLRLTDGRWHDLEIIKARLVDDGGQVAGLIGISLDVTERRQAEEALRLHSSALNAAANAIIITDRTGRITWANHAFLDLSGYAAGEVFGRTPRELLHSGEHPPEFFRELWLTVLAGHVWRGQMINRRKDGTLYNEEQTITPLRDSTGEVTHFIAIKQDVTQLTQARTALRTSEARYRSLFEGSPLPMWVFDDTTLRFLAVNDTAVRQYGYSREEFLGMTIKDIRPPEDVPALLSVALGLSSSAAGHSGEWRHRRKDGTLLAVAIEARPIFFEDRKAMLVVALDITEKKRLQEQFLRAQRMENLGLLAAGIAHDLNNILTPLFIAVPMLREHLTDAGDQRMLGLVQQGADRGAALVRQILAFAHGGGEARHAVQLKHLARDIATMIEETFPRHIQFRLEMPAAPWPVIANPTQIHQVMLNLCVNARDAMPAGGRLGLALRNLALDAHAVAELPGAHAGRYVVIEVSDTGTGIAPELLTRIWEPFFTTKQPDKGTGLGLSTVRGIVSEHEGFCTVQTSPGAGTTFRIFLPAESAAESAAPAAGVAAEVPRGAGESLLVVDDESSVRTLVRVTLVQQGYRVIEAADGAEAIQLVEKHGAGLKAVITDSNMPRLGGEALVAYLRQNLPHVKIIVMSGEGEGHYAHGDEFLPKPFMAETMLAVLHRLLAAASVAATPGEKCNGWPAPQ